MYKKLKHSSRKIKRENYYRCSNRVSNSCVDKTLFILLVPKTGVVLNKKNMFLSSRDLVC